MALEPLSNKLFDTALPAKAVSKSNGKVEASVEPTIAQDSVSITAAGQELAASRDAGTSSTPINEAKVAALRAAIDSGQYQIDPERVASKILQFEKHFPDSS